MVLIKVLLYPLKTVFCVVQQNSIKIRVILYKYVTRIIFDIQTFFSKKRFSFSIMHCYNEEEKSTPPVVNLITKSLLIFVKIWMSLALAFVSIRTILHIIHCSYCTFLSIIDVYIGTCTAAQNRQQIVRYTWTL